MKHRVIGRSGDWVIEKMSAFACTVLVVTRAALREIFDESAYERFLIRTHSVRSVESYREFLREKESALLRKPRCC